MKTHSTTPMRANRLSVVFFFLAALGLFSFRAARPKRASPFGSYPPLTAPFPPCCQAEGSVTRKSPAKTMTGWAVTGTLVGGLLHGGKGAAVGAAAAFGPGPLNAETRSLR